MNALPTNPRCDGCYCPSKALCHLTRPVAKGEMITPIAAWVRRKEGADRCDMFEPRKEE